MKVAVSASGKSLDSKIDPRFGRCANFIIVETEDLSYEAFSNENNALVEAPEFNRPNLFHQRGPRA
jgi:predicted Fe-Mo cluster-binding NifX family protein